MRGLVAALTFGVVTTAQALPSFDWHRPPSEPIQISEINQKYHVQRSAIKLSRSIRIPVVVRLEEEKLQLEQPYLITSILMNVLNATEATPKPRQQIFSHRARFGGGNAVNYEYSNFCEWLFDENSLQAVIPLPNTNLARKNHTLVRDIMIYAGFGGAPRERIVDIELTLQVIDHGKSGQVILFPYGRGCEVLRKAASVPELLKASDQRGLNRDIIVRTDNVSGIVSDQPLTRDNFQSILIDMPAYQRSEHTPVITLSFTSLAEAHAVKVLASSYFQSTIWEAKILHPLTSAVLQSDGRYAVRFDLAAISNKLQSSASIFSGRTVAIALFMLTDRLVSDSKSTVQYKLEMHGPPVVQSLTGPMEIMKSSTRLSWDRSSVLIGFLAIVCAILLLQGLARTISVLIEKRAGYELLASGDCRTVL